MKRLIIYGPPGTGKTTTLLRYLEEHLKAGADPERIAFLTFTRRAKREALERVEKVLGKTAKDLPHFRTIHSMAYKALKLKDGDVLTAKDLVVFGEGMGLTFGRSAVTELAAEGINSGNDGDTLMALDNLARLRGQPLREAFDQANTGLTWLKVRHFSDSYAKYKGDTGTYDFTDVLLEFVRRQLRLPVDIAFVDEAQDLSALQWLAALQAVEGAEQQYVAGDDDQALFKWCGADVETFLALPGERVVLDHSYRLPRIVHTVAQRVVNRIKHRVPKEYTPRDADGRIVTHGDMGSIKIEPGQEWLWLVRNRYLIMRCYEHLVDRGIVFSQHGTSSITDSHRSAIYTWERLRTGRKAAVAEVRDMYKLLASGTQVARGHKLLPGMAEDAQVDDATLRDAHGLLAAGVWFDVFKSIPLVKRTYYRKLLRTHNTLKLAPQVQLETIHGAKGAQADYVALFTEQSRRVYEEAQRAAGADDEHRVFFTGITRARLELHVVLPAGPYAYQLPSLRT